MRKLLEELEFNDYEINELLIHSRNSELMIQALDTIKHTKTQKATIKKLLLLIKNEDYMKPITVDANKLSTIIGLSVRQINALRKKEKIPYVLFSGDKQNNKGGRRTYLYELQKVKEALKLNNSLEENI